MIPKFNILNLTKSDIKLIVNGMTKTPTAQRTENVYNASFRGKYRNFLKMLGIALLTDKWFPD